MAGRPWPGLRSSRQRCCPHAAAMLLSCSAAGLACPRPADVPLSLAGGCPGPLLLLSSALLCLALQLGCNVPLSFFSPTEEALPIKPWVVRENFPWHGYTSSSAPSTNTAVHGWARRGYAASSASVEMQPAPCQREHERQRHCVAGDTLSPTCSPHGGRYRPPECRPSEIPTGPWLSTGCNGEGPWMTNGIPSKVHRAVIAHTGP